MSSELKHGPLIIELSEHKEFYQFGQSSFSTVTSISPEWNLELLRHLQDLLG